MRTWVIPWLVPVGMVGAIALPAAINSPVGDGIGVVWALGVIAGILMIMHRSPEGRARLQELETHYWRSNRR